MADIGHRDYSGAASRNNQSLQTILKGMTDASTGALDNNAKLEQLIKGAQLSQEGEKSKIGAQHQADLASQQEAINRMQDMQSQDEKLQPGSKRSYAVSKEGVSSSEAQGNPMQQSAMQAQKLSANYDKNVGKKYDSQLAPLETLHSLLDNPNAINDQQIRTNLARLAEGPNQRLMQSVIQHSGGNPAAFKSGQDAINWLTGKAQSGFTADQKNAIRESLLQHQDLLEKSYQDDTNRFKKIAGQQAPMMQDVNGYVDSLGSNTKSQFDRLADRKKQYKTNAGAQSPLNQPQPPAYSPPGILSQGVDKLKNWFGGGGSANAPAPSQAVAPGSKPKLSFEDWKKARDAGTL